MKYLLSIMIIAFLSFSCDDDTVTPSESNILMPLALQNTWTYKSYRFNSSNPNERTEESTFQREVIEEITFDSHLWYKFKHSQTTNPTNLYFRNKEDGLWRIDIDENGDVGTEELILKYPSEVGDTSYANEHQVYILITGKNKIITTESGTFNCIQYRTVFNNVLYQYNYDYYSPKVGQVLTESYTIDSQNTDTVFHHIELVDYDLK